MGAITEDDVRARLRDAVAAAGGQQKWAEAHGASPQYVNDVLRRHRKPGDKILAGLRLVRRTIYTGADDYSESEAA